MPPDPGHEARPGTVRVSHGLDLSWCLHCVSHANPNPRKARPNSSWCRKCREYHRDPRKRTADGALRCPVCTLKPSD